jgi:hypothetical protein
MKKAAIRAYTLVSGEPCCHAENTGSTPWEPGQHSVAACGQTISIYYFANSLLEQQTGVCFDRNWALQQRISKTFHSV